MEVNPLTIAAIVGVASLLIERVFYYSSKYKKNPGKYGERIAKLEEAVDNIKQDIIEINRKLNRKK